MKLAIGSVQLGMRYGINNNKRINKVEFKKIEKLILLSKVSYIDTSINYGFSEKVIGNSKLNNLKIISKIKLPSDYKMGIIEGGSSNLFVVSNGVLYTPSLDLGPLGGTMRMQIINLALANEIKVYECNISPQNLLVADEVFLTNAIQGVIWVDTYRTKEYSNETAIQFTKLLNDKWR